MYSTFCGKTIIIHYHICVNVILVLIWKDLLALLAVHTFTSVILNGLHQHNEPIIYWAKAHLKHKSI